MITFNCKLLYHWLNSIWWYNTALMNFSYLHPVSSQNKFVMISIELWDITNIFFTSNINNTVCEAIHIKLLLRIICEMIPLGTYQSYIWQSILMASPLPGDPWLLLLLRHARLWQDQTMIYRWYTRYIKARLKSNLYIWQQQILIFRYIHTHTSKVLIACLCITQNIYYNIVGPDEYYSSTQIAKFMGPTWGPPGSCWPQMGPMLAPWTLLSG